jgi:gamma-glutamylcyclotransferase (GGCT)/AIG2-like uncharacterized protein YtfP
MEIRKQACQEVHMPHVFTYGSLMFARVWSRIVAGSYDRQEAILQGYDRKRIKDEDFPAVVPSSAHSRVAGFVYRDVSLSDICCLDRFEGEYYYRKTEEVVAGTRKIIAAEVYVLKEEYYTLISQEKWDPVSFSTSGIHNFIHKYLDADRQ